MRRVIVTNRLVSLRIKNGWRKGLLLTPATDLQYHDRMKTRLGVVMDPIQSIKVNKDSTFAMLLAAQRRNWSLDYMEQSDLYLRDDRACARMRELQVRDDPDDWYQFGPKREAGLDTLDVLLMRKDPPFDMEYIYTTYLLELAEQRGTLIVNRPATLRDANEKMFTASFPQCAPPTLVSRRAEDFRHFHTQHRDIIVKPLEGMGGASVFRVRGDDPNLNVIIETLTSYGSRFAMAQRFIPEVTAGDKRILMIAGRAVPYALARIPVPGETRANLAAGAEGRGQALSERDRWIAGQVGPMLREKGILFAGLDVIGNYLTEINITSPTCVRELDGQFGLDIAGDFLDAIEERLTA